MTAARDATGAWLEHLAHVAHAGQRVEPRGEPTVELLHKTFCCQLARPMVKIRQRKLQPRFAAAEAHWILTGDDTLAGIVPWNKEYGRFSDDGLTTYGAYGPRVVDQMPGVVAALVRDVDTRQASLTTWRPNPPATKDLPCTMAWNFQLRRREDGRLELNAHVFMRSSDVWLGLPYDVFSFSMVALHVLGAYNLCSAVGGSGVSAWPGRLWVTAASSHLYDRNRDGATACIRAGQLQPHERQAPVPAELWAEPDAQTRLVETLRSLRYSEPGDPLRWWEKV